jgi:predicted anti-sigma-YlaC factor YlaD
MGCETCREALSARLDGEDWGVSPSALQAHLRGCAACSGWPGRLSLLHRAARVAPADPVPDRTTYILAAATLNRSHAAWAIVLRWVLVVVGAVEMGMAAPEILGRWHTGGELGTWGAATAVGFLSVALRPSRAVAVLPMLACAGVVTLFISTRDIADGTAFFSQERSHLLLLAGVAVLAVLRRTQESADLRGPRPRARFDDAAGGRAYIGSAG